MSPSDRGSARVSMSWINLKANIKFLLTTMYSEGQAAFIASPSSSDSSVRFSAGKRFRCQWPSFSGRLNHLKADDALNCNVVKNRPSFEWGGQLEPRSPL